MANAMAKSRHTNIHTQKLVLSATDIFGRVFPVFSSFDKSLKPANFINHFGGKLLRKQEVDACVRRKKVSRIMETNKNSKI